MNPQFFPPQISGLITIISSWLTLELPHNFLTFSFFFLNLQILVFLHKCFHPGAIPPPPNGQCPIAYNRPASRSGSRDQNSKPEGGCGFVHVWFCMVNFIKGIITIDMLFLNSMSPALINLIFLINWHKYGPFRLR